jgi:hypothetical protein
LGQKIGNQAEKKLKAQDEKLTSEAEEAIHSNGGY